MRHPNVSTIHVYWHHFSCFLFNTIPHWVGRRYFPHDNLKCIYSRSFKKSCTSKKCFLMVSVNTTLINSHFYKFYLNFKFIYGTALPIQSHEKSQLNHEIIVATLLLPINFLVVRIWFDGELPIYFIHGVWKSKIYLIGNPSF